MQISSFNSLNAQLLSNLEFQITFQISNSTGQLRIGINAKAGEQAVIDLIEAVSLQHRIDEVLKAEVVDADSKIVQTLDSAIRSRAANLPATVNSGDTLYVRIDEADPVRRRILLTAVS